MHAAAAALVVEHDDGGCSLQRVAAIGPQVGPLGLARSGVELLDGRFIGMQDRARLEQGNESIVEGLQAHAQLAHP